MKIIVCVKQVPDTSGKVAVNPDGTLNRASMQTIINPDDMNAIEAALTLKDQLGCPVIAVSMGPPPAAGMLLELKAMGVDKAVLVSAREFGGSDTFATSQILAAAIKNLGVDEDDIIFCGRQAIDGDTAQVGPQVAEKLGLTQITYTEEIISLDKEAKKIVAKRHIDGGVETVEGPLPIVVTVNGSAAPCRVRNVKRVWANKNREFTTWGAADIEADPAQIGKAGSPTNVKAVKSIVFKAKENKTLTSSDADVESLIVELMESNTIG